jgi:serine/threonine-protein kinase
LTLLAELDLARGQPAAAVEHGRQALDILRAAFPDGHLRIAQAEATLGRALLASGRTGEAEPLLRDSVAVLTAKAGEDDPRTVKAREALAQLPRAPATRADGV